MIIHKYLLQKSDEFVVRRGLGTQEVTQKFNTTIQFEFGDTERYLYWFYRNATCL